MQLVRLSKLVMAAILGEFVLVYYHSFISSTAHVLALEWLCVL